jgi:hypothetical protein
MPHPNTPALRADAENVAGPRSHKHGRRYTTEDHRLIHTIFLTVPASRSVGEEAPQTLGRRHSVGEASLGYDRPPVLAGLAKIWPVNLAGEPEHWLVTLADGSVVDVWADSVEGLAGPEDQRDYLFGNLMDIAPADQQAFEVTARTPANPSRVVVTVARFPRPSVRRVTTAP